MSESNIQEVIYLNIIMEYFKYCVSSLKSWRVIGFCQEFCALIANTWLFYVAFVILIIDNVAE